ncbi:hypothetical protein [Gloeocapsa sp. PCC 7428]
MHVLSFGVESGLQTHCFWSFAVKFWHERSPSYREWHSLSTVLLKSCYV